MKKLFTFFTLAITSTFYHSTAQDLSFDRVMTAGSSRTEMGMGVHVDTEGNVYSTGDINRTVTFGEGGTNQVTLITTDSSLDAFICKQDSTGLVKWAYNIGGSSSDRGLKVKTDKNGNVYLLGYYSGTVDFNPGSETEIRTAEGGQNGFVLKLSKEGNFGWVTTFGGTPGGFDIDNNGNIYVTGYFSGTAKFGNNTLTSGGTFIYVAKMDDKGQFAWSHAIGVAGARGTQQQGLGLCVDAESNVIVTGNYSGTVDFNPGVGVNNLTSNSNSADIFILKLSSSGLHLWSKSIGNSSQDYGHALTADQDNNIYITGYFGGTVDFSAGAGSLNLTSSSGSMDAFVAKYNANGNVVWAKHFGATNMDQGIDIALDALKNVYVTGFTNGNPTVDHSSGTILQGFSGNDIIIIKYNNNGDYQWAKIMGGIKPPNLPAYADSEVGLGIDIDRRNGAVYTVGYYQEFDIDFDPGPGSHIANIRGGADIFVHRLHCPADTFEYTESNLCARSYTFADTNFTESGEYVFYYRELGRCDSIVILNLTLSTNEKPVIQVNERILGTTREYKSYKWLLNGQLIEGATGSTYTVTENGNYQVIVIHENDCVDTSDVYLVENATAINSHPLHNSVIIYPNPANKVIYIKSDEAVNIKLTTIDGKTLIAKNNANHIDLSHLANGLYLVYVFDNKGLLVKVDKVYKK